MYMALLPYHYALIGSVICLQKSSEQHDLKSFCFYLCKQAYLNLCVPDNGLSHFSFMLLSTPAGPPIWPLITPHSRQLIVRLDTSLPSLTKKKSYLLIHFIMGSLPSHVKFEFRNI